MLTADGICQTALTLGIPIGLSANATSGLPNQGTRLSSFDTVLTLNYNRWNQTFTSVSGFYKYDFNSMGDWGNLPVPEIIGAIPENYHQFSQEFRVASGTRGAFEYL